MKCDVEFLAQLIDSISDAVDKLEIAVENNRIEDSKKIKVFILDLYKKIKEECDGD